MQRISCHNGRLLTSALADHTLARPRIFTTGLHAIDELLPHGGFVQGAIHEILSRKDHGTPRFFALLLARSAAIPSATPGQSEAPPRIRLPQGAIICCDPRRELYPPAVAAMGISLDRFFLLHPRTNAEQIWAVTECLRCKGVSATIAHVEKLSRIEARRLQLAAERGGGAGILLRPFDRAASVYAAATRWLVAPQQGERTIQRWTIQLIHGHGGRVGQTVILEHCRETRETRTTQAHPVHPASQLANRPAATATPARRAARAIA